MEQSITIGEVDADHIRMENKRREELGLGMKRILERSYDSVLGQMDAEYRLHCDKQAQEGIAHSIPDQQIIEFSD